jgi:hypothetical protein
VDEELGDMVNVDPDDGAAAATPAGGDHDQRRPLRI